MTTDWLPVRVELTCGDRHLDLHPLHFRGDGSAWQSGLDQRGFDYPPHDWQIGHVGARPVICLSPARQRLFHAGYDHSEKDRHDIALLDRVSAESAPPVSETSGK